jgi:hypothetical protein
MASLGRARWRGERFLDPAFNAAIGSSALES